MSTKDQNQDHSINYYLTEKATAKQPFFSMSCPSMRENIQIQILNLNASQLKAEALQWSYKVITDA